MAPNPRVAKAFRAMRDLGIPEAKTKPVLKKLIKIYEKNWELIEEENYRVLADAIFDSDESEAVEQKKNLDNAEVENRKKLEQDERMKAIEEETQIQEEPEKPLKQLRLNHQDGQPSPSSISPSTNSSGNLLKKPKLEVDEVAESQPELQSMVKTTVTEPISRIDPHPVSPLKQGRNKGKQANLPNVLIKPKHEPLTANKPDLGSDSSGDPPDTKPPTDSSKTGNDFEKKIENGFEENNHLTPIDINDIAKGQESVIISLVNEVNTECPPSFHYIPRNAVFQNAYVDFSLARIKNDNCCSNCFGDCLTSSTPCPCALQTGGEFAYTNEGIIKEDILDECIKTNRDPQKCHSSYCKECPLEKSKNEGALEPCKGHSERSFIKECWLKCGCNKKCGNRVVQGGIKYKLEVFMTASRKGWGLRTLEDLPKGAFVCEFVGEVLTCKEFYNRVSQSDKKNKYGYPVFLDADWGEESEMKEDEALCLDATYYGNVARFINHRCFDANLVEIPVEVENPDRHYYHLAFFTTRKVKPLEELTRDYGIDFDDDDHPVKAFECQCDSRFCRNIKRSSGSRKR